MVAFLELTLPFVFVMCTLYANMRSRATPRYVGLSQKAFDKIFHPELLLKLWSSCITGNAWLWLEVKVGSVSKSMVKVRSIDGFFFGI